MVDIKGAGGPAVAGRTSEQEISDTSAGSPDGDLAQRIRANQTKLRSALKVQYDLLLEE
jgi:hypothetical protein